jgi:hypothetical protein
METGLERDSLIPYKYVQLEYLGRNYELGSEDTHYSGQH